MDLNFRVSNINVKQDFKTKIKYPNEGKQWWFINNIGTFILISYYLYTNVILIYKY